MVSISSILESSAELQKAYIRTSFILMQSRTSSSCKMYAVQVMEAIAISLFSLVLPSTKHTTNWASFHTENDNLRCNTPSRRILVTLQLTSRLKSIYHIYGKIKRTDATILILLYCSLNRLNRPLFFSPHNIFLQ